MYYASNGVEYNIFEILMTYLGIGVNFFLKYILPFIFLIYIIDINDRLRKIYILIKDNKKNSTISSNDVPINNNDNNVIKKDNF